MSIPVGDISTAVITNPVPPTASTAGIVWSISPHSVATIASSGDISGISAGVATVTGTIGTVMATTQITIT